MATCLEVKNGIHGRGIYREDIISHELHRKDLFHIKVLIVLSLNVSKASLRSCLIENIIEKEKLCI